jgi:alpha-ketoglutaric semialdehyde dehydrogenase
LRPGGRRSKLILYIMSANFLHGRNLIGGVPTDTTAHSFHAISPLTAEPLEPAFQEASLAELDRALAHAEDAFGIYRKTSAEARAVLLETIAGEIMALGDALLQRAHEESGLPLDRLTGERGRTAGQLRLFAGIVREGSWVDARIDPALPARQPLPRPDLRRMLVPLGPVAVFGASNFPLAFSVAGGDTASALAAGNPVIVKAHPAHPGASEMVGGAIVRAIERCDLPGGLFSMLHGRGADIGQALVRHPLLRAVGFTGSHGAGRSLFDAANARPDPIPVFAEMSSVNPLFILPGALRERKAAIVEGLKNSVTMGVGQFCTKPGLVIAIGGEDLEEFGASFSAAIRAAAPGTMLHAGILHAYHGKLDAMDRTPGVVNLALSETAAEDAKTQGEPVVYATDSATFFRHPELHQEVFGPCTLIVDAGSFSNMVTIAHRLEGQLTATLHATEEDLAEASDLIAVLERKAGRLLLNGFPTGVEVCNAMHHGGPYPATTDQRFTSVGTAAIQRFARPVCFQNFPAKMLPPELLDENPRGLMRMLDGKLSREATTKPASLPG